MTLSMYESEESDHGDTNGSARLSSGTSGYGDYPLGFITTEKQTCIFRRGNVSRTPQGQGKDNCTTL